MHWGKVQQAGLFAGFSAALLALPEGVVQWDDVHIIASRLCHACGDKHIQWKRELHIACGTFAATRPCPVGKHSIT